MILELASGRQVDLATLTSIEVVPLEPGVHAVSYMAGNRGVWEAFATENAAYARAMAVRRLLPN